MGQMYYNIPHWLRISFPAQPEPIGDGFSPLPSHRMIDLLPESTSNNMDSGRDADTNILARGRTPVRVPSTLRTFLEDSSKDPLNIFSAFSTSIPSASSLLGEEFSGRKSSTKLTKL